jgi:hypothetical protein
METVFCIEAFQGHTNMAASYVIEFTVVQHSGELLCNLSITGMRRTFGQSKQTRIQMEVTVQAYKQGNTYQFN